MNKNFAGKFERPNGVSEEDPLPVPVNNPLPLRLRVKWGSGAIYKNLLVAPKWITVKSDLDMLDNAAEIFLESDRPNDPFEVMDYNRGDLSILVPSSLMSTLVVGTVYYVDVQVLDADEPYTIFYDTIRPYQQVTRAVAAT